MGVLLVIGFVAIYQNTFNNYAYELQDDNRPLIQPVNAPPAAGGMERVLIVVVEGGRADALENITLADNITALRHNSTRLGACTAGFPTFLKTAVGSIYTGAAPFTHPYLTNTQMLPAQMPCESLFQVACRQPGGETMLYGDPSLTTLFAPYVNYTFPDLPSFLTQYAVRKPILAAVHFNATDVAGLAHGGNSPQYASAVAETDNLVGQILRSLEDSVLLNETLVVLTTSSGHVNALDNGRGGNGGEESVVATTYALFSGLGVTRGGWCNVTAHLEDIAPTIAYLMGWPLPTHSNGDVLYPVLNSTAPDALPYQRNASVAVQLTERALGLLNATGNVLRVEKSPEMILNFTNHLTTLKAQAAAATTDEARAAVETSAGNLQHDIDELQHLWVEERIFKERFSRYMGIVAAIFLIFYIAVHLVKRNRFVIEKGQMALGFINAAILSAFLWILTTTLGEYFTFSTFYALFSPPQYPILIATAIFLGGAPLALAGTRIVYIQRNGYAPENDFTSALGIHVMINYILDLWVTILFGFEFTFYFPSASTIFPGYLPTFFAVYVLSLAPAFFGIKRLYDRLLRRRVKPKFEHIIDSRERWHIISRDEQAILEYRRRIMATAAAAREMEAKANNNHNNNSHNNNGAHPTNGTGDISKPAPPPTSTNQPDGEPK